MVYPLYEAKAGNEADKELWIAPDSRHACSFTDHPEEYSRQVEAFVSRYIVR